MAAWSWAALAKSCVDGEVDWCQAGIHAGHPGILWQEALMEMAPAMVPSPCGPLRVAASPVGAEDSLAGRKHMSGTWEGDRHSGQEPASCVPKQSRGFPSVLGRGPGGRRGEGDPW